MVRLGNEAFFYPHIFALAKSGDVVVLISVCVCVCLFAVYNQQFYSEKIAQSTKNRASQSHSVYP